jgi:hypothetical protein
MKKLKVLHVVWRRADNVWAVKHGHKVLATEYRKIDILHQARDEALALGGASVRIHDKHGDFQEERTYPRSRDPRRSKG